MKFTHFLALIAGFTTPAYSETLISGAIYFDSENTLQEVIKLSGERDNNALARLVAAHHVSEKLTENTDILVYLAGPNPESPVEFRFINNPTTYWTLTKFIGGLLLLPVALSTPTPNPTPNAIPTPTSTPQPTPTPKAAVAMREREEAPESETPPPPLRKLHRRVKEYSPSKDEEGVPEADKVWHQVNGHWKWYDKRNLHEVRKALPVAEVPSGTVPAPAPTPLPTPVSRVLPVKPTLLPGQ